MAVAHALSFFCRNKPGIGAGLHGPRGLSGDARSVGAHLTRVIHSMAIRAMRAGPNRVYCWFLSHCVASSRAPPCCEPTCHPVYRAQDQPSGR